MIFWAFVFVRVLMAFLSWGYFVPDETWQSVEVAHKLVFGNGHLTWEWEHGLRSYLHPALFAILFKILKFVNLDTPFLVTIVSNYFVGQMLFWPCICPWFIKLVPMLP